MLLHVLSTCVPMSLCPSHIDPPTDLFNILPGEASATCTFLESVTMKSMSSAWSFCPEAAQQEALLTHHYPPHPVEIAPTPPPDSGPPNSPNPAPHAPLPQKQEFMSYLVTCSPGVSQVSRIPAPSRHSTHICTDMLQIEGTSMVSFRRALLKIRP